MLERSSAARCPALPLPLEPYVMPFGFAMYLADQRTGGVEKEELAALRFGRHLLRHSMGRKDHGPVVRNGIELVHEDRALCLQAFDDEAVVDDLVAHVDRRPEPLERQLDDLDGAVDAGAEAARSRDQDAQGRVGAGHGGDVSNCLPG